ncbi:hypothetical protein Hamer_G029539 [Homarus americanus]|uniref:Uncharacterized protein n=1 Tax=Homarus americanus TaxID=6706 RepID=A0A8J5JH64_HOMAM|nr:hypothetical protein Hamer_G029539 [Homarus americanus]
MRIRLLYQLTSRLSIRLPNYYGHDTTKGDFSSAVRQYPRQPWQQLCQLRHERNLSLRHQLILPVWAVYCEGGVMEVIKDYFSAVAPYKIKSMELRFVGRRTRDVSCLYLRMVKDFSRKNDDTVVVMRGESGEAFVGGGGGVGVASDEVASGHT